MSIKDLETYQKPKTIVKETGEKVIISAYTNREIKVYEGETEQKRAERLKRNFVTARKNRERQKLLLEDLKNNAKLLKDENSKLSNNINVWRLQKLVDKNAFGNTIRKLKEDVSMELQKNNLLKNKSERIKRTKKSSLQTTEDNQSGFERSFLKMDANLFEPIKSNEGLNLEKFDDLNPLEKLEGEPPARSLMSDLASYNPQMPFNQLAINQARGGMENRHLPFNQINMLNQFNHMGSMEILNQMGLMESMGNLGQMREMEQLKNIGGLKSLSDNSVPGFNLESSAGQIDRSPSDWKEEEMRMVADSMRGEKKSSNWDKQSELLDTFEAESGVKLPHLGSFLNKGGIPETGGGNDSLEDYMGVKLQKHANASLAKEDDIENDH